MPSAGRVLWVGVLSAAMCSGALGQSDAGQPFTLRQVMSAAFNSDLTAAPAGGAFAWVANVEGERNIWVAVPSAGSAGYTAHQITNYTDDDGQAIADLTWSPDAQNLLYVRGGSANNPENAAPNPAHLSAGAAQEVWIVSATGGEPRKVGQGSSPTFSPRGDMLTWFSHGQIWYQKPGDIGVRQARAFPVFGDCKSFSWSPDGSKLAFVNDRGSYSFIAVFSPAAASLTFLDPGVDHDSFPAWSPDGRAIAFVRIPYFKGEIYAGPQRTGRPWSIRVVDVDNGQGHEIWKAAAGRGSVFRPLEAYQQLFWTADGHLIFPWEADGWLHLYSVPINGGQARLLTPGEFEVENASFSPDRTRVIYSSNQGDSERRHIWKVSAAGAAPLALSQREGIETHPVMGSDGATIAVLHSDARIPMRPAVLVKPGEIRDLAPQALPPEFPAAEMIAPQPVVYSAADGIKIHAGLFLPQGTKACVRHPAVVFVHGGSQRQMLLGWHSMGYYSYAYALNQYLASRGYVVLAINYRSGTGYGLDFREALHYGSTGASEFRDVEGAAEYLRGRCDVQPKHIGIWGGSWGGFLTAAALARRSDLFSAGVDISGVHDWNIDHPENFQLSDTTDIDARWRLAWQSSPLASVKSWRSPVLLIQGDDDDEVPFLQTVQLAAALREQQTKVQVLVFPDEVHDFLLFRNWLSAYTATVNFFDENLGAGGNSAHP